MPASKKTNPDSAQAECASRKSRKTTPVNLAEEIDRIQVLLRLLDEKLKGQDDISLKDLSQAVRTAGDGGRSIAQLRKLARQMDIVILDDEAEQIRALLFDMLNKLGRRRQEHEVHLAKDGSAML